MDRLVIDFKIQLDTRGRILSCTNFSPDLCPSLETLVHSDPGGKIQNWMDMDIKADRGLVEIDHLMFIYQCIGRRARDMEFVFSHGAMAAEIFTHAMDKMEEGVHIYNRQGYGLYSNDASQRLSGISKADFRGCHLLDMYHLHEDYSTVLTTLRTRRPVLNRCDMFTTVENKKLTTINSAYPVFIDERLCGAILMENDLQTLEKQARKNLHLNRYLGASQKTSLGNRYYQFKDIIHHCEKMKDLIRFAKKISLGDASILILGGTGTGKELLAQSIHSFGKDNKSPFVPVNCAAIPDNLAESLFFGTVKGAFTGSINSLGFFGQANGGTLFLDEINSMNLDMQSKLLRTLQDKTYRRVGSHREHPVNVRIIAASNEDLYTLVQEKRIRPDFYYRIATITLDLPRLAHRGEDINLLTDSFIADLNGKHSKSIEGLSPRAMELFGHYPWPGNIRELKNVLECAFALVEEDETHLCPEHFPKYLNQEDVCYSVKLPVVGDESLKGAMAAYERQLVEAKLKANGWNISKTARELGIKRQSLQYRIQKFKLQPPGVQNHFARGGD